MSFRGEIGQFDDLHPIDMVEDIAAGHAWEFDRVADDQIAMAVEGQWRTYSVTLAWSAVDETLRLICTFEIEPPRARMGELFDVMNRCNDLVWMGAFTYWAEQKLMVWRYGLCLAGGQTVVAAQVDALISSAIVACERFFPAFQLVAWADKTPASAMQVAMAEAYGRA